MKKLSRKGLIKILDKLIDQIVYKRDKDTCQKCGKKVEGKNRQGSHVIPQSAGHKLRWDELNLKVMCMHCHLHWWHKNPTEAGDWFKEKFPERWEYLKKNKGIAQYKEHHLLELKEKLEKRLNQLDSRTTKHT